MNKVFVNNVGDLAEAQRASFYRFLSSGISEEILIFPNPFFARVRILERQKRIYALIYLYSNSIKLKGPNSNLDMCVKRHISYTIQIFIPAFCNEFIVWGTSSYNLSSTAVAPNSTISLSNLSYT
jgi:hypothetical protein